MSHTSILCISSAASMVMRALGDCASRVRAVIEQVSN